MAAPVERSHCATTQSDSSLFGPNTESSDGNVFSENGNVCETFREQIRGVQRYIKNSPTGVMRSVYPKQDVCRVLTYNAVRSLLHCACHRCRGILSPAATEQDIATIFSEYRLILAILLEMDRLYLIHSFVENKYTDERALARPLEKSELERIVDQIYTKLQIRDKYFARNFHHRKQYEFLLPNISTLAGTDVDGIESVNINQALPIHLTSQLGRGGYGAVYRASLFEGYHDLSTTDGHVAVKIISIPSGGGSGAELGSCGSSGDCCSGGPEWDDQDYGAETRLNRRFQHANIVPMLASLCYGPELVSFYPIARMSLHALMGEPAPTFPHDTTARIVGQVADLFSALDRIHTGDKHGVGYHLDIKPANILVRNDHSFALTDLGMGHFKACWAPAQPQSQDRSLSTIRMRPFSEYAGPEMAGKWIHRSFDIWPMGCVFLELLVWHAEGSAGVAEFRRAREEKKACRIVAYFHEDGEVKNVVREKVVELEERMHDDHVFRGALGVVKRLLNPDEAQRPTAREAEGLIRTLLRDHKDSGRDVRTVPSKQHGKSLLRDYRNEELVQRRKLPVRGYATYILSTIWLSLKPPGAGFRVGLGVGVSVGVAATAMIRKSWK
ncbi:kinase-like domain-containing protein [Tricharina praecox]|uniref:kinase-like domain-containing protein n=1 Tax=Tricharina praecox TaxID=43433 RepID=UPI00221F1154|nr:kinase-like domain-containing protein [Tricharina praecox]KAI5851968.1 kinase-like domain-containing protein [Tricharina praecox]